MPQLQLTVVGRCACPCGSSGTRARTEAEGEAAPPSHRSYAPLPRDGSRGGYFSITSDPSIHETGSGIFAGGDSAGMLAEIRYPLLLCWKITCQLITSSSLL